MESTFRSRDGKHFPAQAKQVLSNPGMEGTFLPRDRKYFPSQGQKVLSALLPRQISILSDTNSNKIYDKALNFTLEQTTIAK